MSSTEPKPTPSKKPHSVPTSQENLSMIISQSLGIAAQNAVVAQQMGNILHTATTAVGIDIIYSDTQKTLKSLLANTQTTSSPKSLTQVLQDMQQAVDTLKNIESKSVNKDTSDPKQ